MIYTVKEINGAAQLIVADEWDETKHPRDEQGRFTEGSAAKPVHNLNNDLPTKQKQVKIRRRVLRLEPEEFRRVQSAFMTDVTPQQRKVSVLRKHIGDYLYTGILREDGTRDIVRKVKIR